MVYRPVFSKAILGHTYIIIELINEIMLIYDSFVHIV